MARPIDSAMNERRPEKETMRQLWVDEVGSVRSDIKSKMRPPLYLTLPGSEGIDVQMLIERQIVKLAENKAIAPEDEWKVVAVERNNAARYNLKNTVKGLKVIGEDLDSVLSPNQPTAYPGGELERCCRAHVVNLDLNGPLHCQRQANGHLIFPTVAQISKFAQLHRKEPILDWTLCLTVAAEIHWSSEECKTVQKFLCENFQREPQFARDSRSLLGDAMFEALSSGKSLNMIALSDAEKQALLMVFIPKRIIADTYSQGWKILTTHNLRYGGSKKSQRMVSFVMKFTSEPRVAAEPRAVYSENLAGALASAGSIDTEGVLGPN